MTHNVKRSQKTLLTICKRPPRVLNHRSEKLMATKVLKLLKMEATTKASEAAGTAVSSSTAGSAQQPVDGGGGGGGGATGAASLDNNSEFYNTGRVGRRNALPDILNHHHSTTSTADLPDKLGALSTTDTSEEGASK